MARMIAVGWMLNTALNTFAATMEVCNVAKSGKQHSMLSTRSYGRASISETGVFKDMVSEGFVEDGPDGRASL